MWCMVSVQSASEITLKEVHVTKVLNSSIIMYVYVINNYYVARGYIIKTRVL